MIASPSDVAKERTKVVEALAEWNRHNTAERKCVFLPLRWEEDSAARMGCPPQETLNRQLCERSDMLIAIFWTRLSSAVGFKGIAKKVCIFVLVGIANILDTQVLQNGTAICTAVIFFYLANEGISILENSAAIGIPIPAKLRDMLIQLSDEKKLPGKDEKPEDDNKTEE